MKIVSKALSYLKSALSEPQGTGSYTRLAAYTLVCAWVIFGFIIFFFSKEHITEYLYMTSTLILSHACVKVVTANVTKDSTAQAMPPNQTTQP